MVDAVLRNFDHDGELLHSELFGAGLINITWKITTTNGMYILQRLNEDVFNAPEDIAHNIDVVAGHLRKHHPEYNFPGPVASRNGSSLLYLEGRGYFRLFPFVEGSFSKNVADTPQEAFEAASQFGRFTKMLNGLDVRQLKTTIPAFHDLVLRYEQFIYALEKGNKARIDESASLIKTLVNLSDIVVEYKRITSSPDFKLRVTHHDTKISNVLFDENGKGLCVIDLDTVMPGYFISDVGDMMRTYLSPVNEEEPDFSRIEVRDNFYHAIVSGYCREIGKELSPAEQASFFFSGVCMTYMQAIRFLTDYLNNDVYYGARYSRHNLVRAGNQITLLERLIEKEKILTKE
jgi:Ser/Thr protein kinase RdoA (MazF antagonist)